MFARENWNKGYERAATTTQEGCRRVLKGELFFIYSQEVVSNSVMRQNTPELSNNKTGVPCWTRRVGYKEGRSKVKHHGRGLLGNK